LSTAKTSKKEEQKRLSKMSVLKIQDFQIEKKEEKTQVEKEDFLFLYLF